MYLIKAELEAETKMNLTITTTKTKTTTSMATRNSVSKTRGDNSIQKFLFVLLVVICASKGFSIACAVVTPEVDLQQLSNDKMRYFNLQEITSGSSYRQQQQQQRQAQLQVIANDLQEQSDVANDGIELHKSRQQHHHLQQQQQQQQQHQPHQRQYSSGDQAQTSGSGKFVSQGNVINGNHATYVEPPADFKPIIYDYDKQQQQQQQQQQHQHQQAQSQNRQPVEGLESSLNQMVPSFSSPLSNTQKHQLASVGSSTTELPTEPADNFSGDKSVLKPSIGRWSDWHDMSIEPDLASSDSSAQATFYSLPHYAPFALHPPAFIAPYRTRYQARPDSSLIGTKKVETMPEQRQQQQHQTVFQPATQQVEERLDRNQQQQQQENVEGATKIGQNVGQFSVSDNQEGSVVKRTLSQLQIKGGQRINQQQQQGSASGPIKSATPAEMPEMALNRPEISSQNDANSNNIKLQQNHDFNQQQQQQQQAAASNFPAASGLKQQQQSTDSVKIQGLQQQHQKKKQANRQSKTQQSRPKRRRKSKTNAEVRIQQLVAASQQQQQELLANGKKQVNGLVLSPPSANGMVLTNQKQFQQHYQPAFLQQQVEYSTGQQLLNQINVATQNNNAHQLPAQQQLTNILLTNSKTNNHQQHKVFQQQGILSGKERMLNARQLPTKSLNYQTLGNIHLHNRPAIVVKRIGNFPLTSQSQSQSQQTQVSNASAPIKAAPGNHQQQLRKRKIKTQLPVGLSSWFLGGIRDLDGRHWHLPAEVINRLAVNDVDLAGSDKMPKVSVPIGSVIIVPPQNVEFGVVNASTPNPSQIQASNVNHQSTQTPSSTPSVNRVPINQLIPR